MTHLRLHETPNLDVHQTGSSSNHGEYMLIATERNFVVLGERFNATLEEILTYLA